jgi:uncharacterized repeat protein (TIGR02543 family)
MERMMKKNKIIVFLVTVITLMGLFACPDPLETTKIEYCSVSFNKNGGDSADIADLKVEKGKTMGSKYPKDPSRNGYKFDGWYDEKSVIYRSDSKVTKDLKLYARWEGLTYKVIFNKNNTDPESTDANPDAKTVTVPLTNINALPTAPKRTGYTFYGWNTDAEGKGTAFDLSTTVSADITVYALWIVKVNEYTVTFNKNANDATEPSPATKTVTALATTIDALPTAPTRTGYTFAGWNTQFDGKGTVFVQTTTVSTSITVYAQWIVAKSSNANIRAVSSGASGNANAPLGTFGLYVGGIPATSNGTPSTTGVTTGTGTGAPTNGTIGGNGTSDATNSSIVVIVEDSAVSKVEFGRNGATNDTTEPTWQTLARTNDANTPTTLTNRRWVGKLAETNATNNWRFWVRITAEDGTTTNIYRYTHNVGNNAGYCTLSSLTIGGWTVSNRGTTAGLWNTTVAPNLTAGNVTIKSGDNVAIAAAWNIGSSNASYNYAIIPHTVTWPLKEGDYTPTFTTGNPTSISGINDGDYILLRAQCTPGGATSVPIVGHYIIKVKVSNHLPAYIGITSDVHWDRSTNSTTSGQTQIFESWMTKLKTHYPNLDYMLFGGDNGSAYTTGIIHWNNIAEFIPIADSYVTSGFIRNQNIFITGNHEYQITAGGALLDNIDNPLTLSGSSFTTVRSVAERLNYNKHWAAVTNSDYVIYTFGTRPASTPSSSFQEFLPADIDELSQYLKTAPKDIPIIILTHFPLHRFASDRYTKYAGEMIDLLNQYPNVIMLWGHNHSNSDSMYQSIKVPGYTMNTTSGTSNALVTKAINFLYVPMGGMRDAEYKDGKSVDIKNKGLVLKIDGTQLTFMYYDKDCNVTNESGWEAVAVYNLTGSGYVKQP